MTTATSQIITDEKKCYMCGQWWPKTKKYFSIDRSTKDGWNNYCKPCNNKKAKIRYRKIKAKMKPQESKLIKCKSCVFLQDCRDFIWDVIFTPSCFTSSPTHDLYQKEYGGNGRK